MAPRGALFEDSREVTFVLLLYQLQRGEVLGLRWQDIDQTDSEIRRHVIVWARPVTSRSS